MPGIAPRLSEREERIRSLLHFFRNVNRSTSNSASNFPPLSNDVVELIDATRSVWLDIDDFESWLNEARAPTVLRDILSNAAWEDTTETLSMRSLELIIQSLLIVQGSGLSLRSRDCLVANCHNPVEENYTRQSEFQTVEINVNLQRSGGHWCVGSLPIYPVVRPHRNSRYICLCNVMDCACENLSYWFWDAFWIAFFCYPQYLQISFHTMELVLH